MLVRYNLYSASFINGDASAGTSSGEAIDRLQEIAEANLAPSMRREWTELAFLQRRVGNTAMYVFILAVVLVFLVLAAQYESWSLPLAVILVVPMCLLCSVAGVIVAHMDINIFTQIGFVVLVGLACKNAILIVEFAQHAARSRVHRFEATLGGLPAALAADHHDFARLHLRRRAAGVHEGAGAEMRRTLGTAVFSRHAWRHDLRHLPDAGLLLRDPMVRGLARVRRKPESDAPAITHAPEH